VKLVIANNYGEDDQFARHTFYQQQTSMSSAPARRLSCYIVFDAPFRLKTTSCWRKRPLSGSRNSTGTRRRTSGRFPNSQM